MSWPFLITGLPRSRTAWFAIATGAIHEPDELPNPWDWGVSDHHAGFRLKEIIRDVGPKTLIIERPKSEVIASMIRYCGTSVPIDWDKGKDYLDRLSECLTYDHPLIKRVAYNDLLRRNVIESCLQWLGVRCRNVDQLMNMRIESKLEYNLRRVLKAA